MDVESLKNLAASASRLVMLERLDEARAQLENYYLQKYPGMGGGPKRRSLSSKVRNLVDQARPSMTETIWLAGLIEIESHCNKFNHVDIVDEAALYPKRESVVAAIKESDTTSAAGSVVGCLFFSAIPVFPAVLFGLDLLFRWRPEDSWGYVLGAFMVLLVAVYLLVATPPPPQVSSD